MKIAGGDAKAASAASVALEARRRIDAMFKVDSKFDDMEPGGRKAARDAELRPLMEDFGGWARAQLVCVQLVVAGLVTMIFRV
ncbi:MAG: hypothetical protein ACLU7Y_04295 [Bifidobacterium longum]|uniref:hypothetical protein n=1 Tax=Bifidobacterium longum TaxID=216816 RepID=UPI000B18AE1B|nr:hypothetical protein [Bifidobacterium longum]